MPRTFVLYWSKASLALWGERVSWLDLVMYFSSSFSFFLFGRGKRRKGVAAAEG